LKCAEEPCFKISIIFASATSPAISLATSPAIPPAIPLRIFKSILAYSVFGLRSSEDGSGTAIVSLKLITAIPPAIPLAMSLAMSLVLSIFLKVH
jgi:hypothetical protein